MNSFKPKRLGQEIIELFLFLCASSSVLIVFFVSYIILIDGSPAVWSWFLNGFGYSWRPGSISEGGPSSISDLGIIPLLFSSTYVGIGSVLLSLPIAIPTGVYLAEYAPPRTKRILKPALETLIGIPSIIMGILGASLIRFLIYYFTGYGDSVLSAWIILSMMSISFIATVTEDSINSVPFYYREASLALGATKWQTIYRIILPSAISGIIAATVLALGRAIGETTAVLFVIGGLKPGPLLLRFNPLLPSNVITNVIVQEYPEAARGDIHWQGLYGLGFMLFLVVTVLNFVINYVSRRSKLG